MTLFCFVINHFSQPVAIIWPAIGLVFGWLFTRGTHFAIGVFIGTWLYGLWKFPEMASLYALLRTVEAIGLVQGTRYLMGPYSPLKYKDSLGKFLVFSGIISGLSTFFLLQILPIPPLSAFLAHYGGLVVLGLLVTHINYYVPA